MADETSWRRRWTPTLAACPWQSVEVDGSNLLIKIKFTNKSYEILITDMTSFWYENLEEHLIEERIEKLNPIIEAPITKILDQIKLNLEKPDKGTKLSYSLQDGQTRSSGLEMQFNISSSLAGMPFVWNFDALPADDDMAANHLTMPLLAMVSELFRRQGELMAVLAAKDKELDDYKSQGVRTSRKHIETTKFDNIAFKNSMVTSKGFEDRVKTLKRATFDSEGQELYRQIVTKHAWLAYKASGGGDEEAMSDDEESVPMSDQGAASAKQSWTNRLPPSLAPSKGASPTETPTGSPSKSPTKSPAKSPGSSSSASDSSSAKDTEQMRREALERKLELEEVKKQEKKKKKKLAF